MKQIFRYSLFFLALNFNTVTSQDKLTENQKLFATAKVWGFLKYYHPNVAAGKFDWDNQLFQILVKIEEVDSKEELSTIYLNWVESLGDFDRCKKCHKKSKEEYFDKNFDLSWLQDGSILNGRLGQTLEFIKDNRYIGKHHYINQNARVGNIIFTNEPVYNLFSWEDENLRVLALFKYWNMIEYFYPYKYMTDQSWDNVLVEMIPKFLHPKSELDYHLAMLELVVNLDDSHAGLSTEVLDDYFGMKYIPVIHQLVENKAVITRLYNDSLAKLNDMRIGDIITKVGNTKISEIIARNENYIQGSNKRAKEAYAWNKIFNGNNDSLKLEFKRNDSSMIKVVARYLFSDFDYKKENRPKARVLEDNIGYINMGEVENKDFSHMADTLFNTKALILDIRNYPKESVLSSLPILNTNDSKPFYKALIPDLSFPGKFFWKSGDIYQNSRNQKYKGKIVLLVNERTISLAEFICMYLQASSNSTTIGSTTLAADGDISPIHLVGEFKTWMSGIGIFYPDGTETQRKGVKIDLVVNPTINGIRQGRDEVLEKAIEIINQ